MSRRPRPLALTAALALLTAAPAAAQVIRFPTRQDPSAWASLSAGVLQFQEVVDDGTTETAWNFETTAQLRASLERSRGGGTSYGVVGTYARPSLCYTQAVGGGGLVNTNATATVSSVSAVFRAGGGAGLHQVIEVSGGARYYSGFDASGASQGAGRLRPDGDWDPIASLGFGFGYPLGQRAAVTLVQDAEFVFHQRDEGATSGFNGGIHRSYVTRLGARFGFGNRSRIR